MKRFTATMYYKLISMMGVTLVANHADYRLISKKALHEFRKFGEVNLFLRGMVPLIGYNTAVVYYKRNKREHGKSKYNYREMTSFAWQGIISFSTFPLRLIFQIGVLAFILSLILIGWVLYTYMAGKSVPGWSSTLIPIVFFSGLQGIFTGVIGQYIAKIYMEVKARPRYIIEEKL